MAPGGATNQARQAGGGNRILAEGRWKNKAGLASRFSPPP